MRSGVGLIRPMNAPPSNSDVISTDRSVISLRQAGARSRAVFVKNSNDSRCGSTT